MKWITNGDGKFINLAHVSVIEIDEFNHNTSCTADGRKIPLVNPWSIVSEPNLSGVK